MSRAWRIEYEGALYHLLSRGNERRDIFKDERDRNIFLDTISEFSERGNVGHSCTDCAAMCQARSARTSLQMPQGRGGYRIGSLAEGNAVVKTLFSKANNFIPGLDTPFEKFYLTLLLFELIRNRLTY